MCTGSLPTSTVAAPVSVALPEIIFALLSLSRPIVVLSATLVMVLVPPVTIWLAAAFSLPINKSTWVVASSALFMANFVLASAAV